MNISTKAIVSNSEMIKNYKACRDKADGYGKIFVLKNNQPDAVLFSIAEYERLSVLIEYAESLDEEGINKVIDSILNNGVKQVFKWYLKITEEKWKILKFIKPTRII